MYIVQGVRYEEYLLKAVVEFLVFGVVAELPVELPHFLHQPPPGREGVVEGGRPSLIHAPAGGRRRGRPERTCAEYECRGMAYHGCRRTVR